MNAVNNPCIPFNAPIPGGVQPGKMIRIHGSVPITSHRFAVNLVCGPLGDIALHVCPRFLEKQVVRNSVQSMNWGHEERHGSMPIHPGQTFDLLILCDPHYFKIAFNGHHFAEFNHRISYSSVTNLAIDGEVSIFSIHFDGQGALGAGHMGLVAPSGVHPPPYAPQPGHVPHVPHASHVPHMPHQPHQPHLPHHAGVGMPYTSHPVGSPYPHNVPAYPMHGSHHQNPPQQSPYPRSPTLQSGLHPSYPTSQPGPYPTSSQPGMYPHSPTSHKKTGLLDKAGMAMAGVLGTSALAGAGGAGGHKASKLGLVGGGLGAAVAGAALTGHLNPIKAMKKQKKAQKKALKYGLPIAGAGIGAYALHKGMHKLHHHGHHRSSSSSSSSSSD